MKRRRPGLLFRIDLQNGYFTYAYENNKGAVVIVDALTEKELPIDEIASRSPLFTVYADAETAKWNKVGYADLKPEQLIQPLQFIQDPINLSIRTIDDKNQEKPARLEEVQGLERAAGWDGFHVEQRIRDHYAGKTNRLFQAHRPKPENAPHYRASTPYIPQPGAIKQIDLGDEIFAYARELHNTFFAFYDSRTIVSELPPLLTQLPVLFTVSVSLHARLGWKKVGYIHLKAGEHPLPRRYLQVGPTRTDVNIYDNPYDPEFKSRSGTLQEAEGLEPAIMWDNYQVENRLRAFYNGKPWHLGPA